MLADLFVYMPGCHVSPPSFYSSIELKNCSREEAILSYLGITTLLESYNL